MTDWHGIPEEYRNKVVQGDCRELGKRIPDNSIDLIFTDPPYFRVKGEDWDRQWKNADIFIDWLEFIVKDSKRVLKENGSIYLFASPKMNRTVENLMSKYFRVLNNIRWVKEEGWHKKAEKEILRSYLSPWESIIFAEQYADQYGELSKALHKEVYAPIGRYIQTERERAGYTRNDVEVALGFVSSQDPTRGTALCYRWEEGSSLPTRQDYYRMREFLNNGTVEYLRREYEELRREYEELRREYEELRRPFTAGKFTDDVITYPTVQTNGKHPCEKPVGMIAEFIKTSSRKGDIVLDMFAGSGAHGEAAIATGRRFIGFEKTEKYIRGANERLKRTKRLWHPNTQANMFGGLQ